MKITAITNAYNPNKAVATHSPMTKINRLGLDSVSFSSKQGAAMEMVSTIVGEKPHISSITGRFNNIIKAVCSDIDGTLLDKDKNLPESAAYIIQQLHKKAVNFILVSGRSASEMEGIIAKLPERPEFLITQHGAEIVNSFGETVSSKGLSPENVVNIIKAAREYRAKDPVACLMFYAGGKVYHEAPHQLGAKSHIKPTLVENLEEILDKGMTVTKAMLRKEDSKSTEDLTGLYEYFKSVVDTSANPFRSSQRSFEIINSDVTKGTGVEEVAKHLKLSLKNIMGIGDEGTDRDMLKLLKENEGLAVAMGNSGKGVLEAAEYVTDAVDANGFYVAGRKVIRNNEMLRWM